MDEIYTVYLLYSRKYKKNYVGQTHDLNDRMLRHNNGMVRSTKPYRPWEIIHTEYYKTRSESMSREKWFKSGIGRKFIKVLLENSGIK